MAPTALDRSIAAIDELIVKLHSGALCSEAAPAVHPVHQGARRIDAATAPSQPAAPLQPATGTLPPPPPTEAKPKAAKKGKAADGGAAGPLEGADLFAKARFVVARVESVAEHPTSHKLYVTQLDVGGGVVRQVVAGLRKHVAVDALRGSLVAVCLNLKPARLAGEASEGMILAASTAEGEAERVQPLQPPEACNPGDPLYLQSAGALPDGTACAKQLKGEQWRKIAGGLAVGAGEARFEGEPVVTTSGVVLVPGMPDGAEIH